MNIFIIIVSLLFICNIRAEVEVIPVIMGLWHSNHSKELTKVINLKETQGCNLFNVDSHNSATYLYFRCTKNKENT